MEERISNKDRRSEELEKAFYRLRHVTRRLRHLALQIETILLLSIFFCTAFLALSNLFYLFRFIVPVIVPVLNLLGIILLFVFDSTRKLGMVFYDVISDEMERIHRTGINNSIDDHSDMDSRIQLRMFLRATDLPLIPGNAGQGVYLALFILLAIGTLIFYSFTYYPLPPW